MNASTYMQFIHWLKQFYISFKLAQAPCRYDFPQFYNICRFKCSKNMSAFTLFMFADFPTHFLDSIL